MKGMLREREPIQKYDDLEKLLGENFNKEKTFELQKELDENNKPRELGEYRAFWTEFRNPETDEVVEGKIYFPNNAKNYKKIFLISPGYKGDFVLQESYYADDFAKGEKIVIFLRHNALKIQGVDVENFIHCPEKQEKSQKTGQSYLGGNENFNYKKASREVLTVLMALSKKNEQVDQIDVMGHSWGGRIAIQSLVELNKNKGGIFDHFKGKIKNLILLAPWLETRKELLEEKYRDFLEIDERGGYLKGMNVNDILSDLKTTSEEINNLSSDDFPENLRVIGIQSVADEYTMNDASPDSQNINSGLFGFLKRLKNHKNKGNIVLKNISEVEGFPKQLGNRPPEIHDYHLEGGRIRRIINNLVA